MFPDVGGPLKSSVKLYLIPLHEAKVGVGVGVEVGDGVAVGVGVGVSVGTGVSVGVGVGVGVSVGVLVGVGVGVGLQSKVIDLAKTLVGLFLSLIETQIVPLEFGGVINDVTV